MQTSAETITVINVGEIQDGSLMPEIIHGVTFYMRVLSCPQ